MQQSCIKLKAESSPMERQMGQTDDDTDSRQGGRRASACAGGLLLLFLAMSAWGRAQNTPYFVTYSQYMEEPGNLEIANKSAIGNPPVGSRFLGSSLELEYGVKAWWSTELYLDGVAAAHDSTIFTGFRWENRFRPLAREHWINPVLYVEFENINGADKSLLEVVGHDGAADLSDPHALARQEKKREIELKLIL